jgi:protein-disulfide isomerase
MQEEYSTETTTSPSVVQQESSLMSTLGVPIAIVVGALLIGGAIIYTGTTRSGIPLQVGNGANDNEQVTADVEVAPVTDKDHILGNPNAPIMIVEYSDFDCPFCKNFHETMQKIMETYGKDGKVAWVYRHFPLEQLHPNAPKVAAASECVAALGGNDAFWKFANKLISDRGTNEPTNITKLPEYASNAGVDKSKFTACYEAGTYNEKIQKDIEEALKTGARGTPYSVIIVGDQQAVINGAQPYTAVKAMIDNLITQMGGTAE